MRKPLPAIFVFKTVEASNRLDPDDLDESKGSRHNKSD